MGTEGKDIFTRVRKWKGENWSQCVVTLKTEPSPRDFPPVFPSSKSKMPHLLEVQAACDLLRLKASTFRLGPETHFH